MPESRTIFAPAAAKRLVRAAGEIAFLEAELGEHPLDDRDVLGLAAVRGAGERELLVAPLEGVEAARLEKRHHLERLRAGAPEGDEVADRPPHPTSRSSRVDDRRVHPVVGFYRISAGDDDIQLM